MASNFLRLDERRFARLVLLALIGGFLLLAGALVAGLSFLNSAQRSTMQVRETYEVVDQLSLLELQLERAESGRRGYLLASSPYRIEVYRTNAALVPQTLRKLRLLAQDNPDQVPRLDALDRLVSAQVSELRNAMDLALAGRAGEARRQFEASSQQSTIRAARAVTGAIRAAEYRLLDQRIAQERRTTRLAQASLLVIGVLFVAVSLGAFWVVRRYTTDLARTRDRLHELNSNLEGAVRERTTDLQRANDEIQKFAYIVSHDLRSPLVNVMGFTAELETANAAIGKLVERVSEEAPQLLTADVRNAREDLPEAIGFIRSSTRKMDRLINAILALSRQGRRVLTPAHLSMDRVMGEIVASLTALASERGATIRVETPLPDLRHDRLAIDQIFSNLIENATKYTMPGRPGEIVIRGVRHGSRVRFEIEDNGRGIAANDHERIFELFRRSGQQDEKGEGIGLANVRALAYRLGGTVTVRSVLGQGSTFLVDLPVVFSSEERKAA
jgi:signal transduction histidine kinase